MKLGEIAEIQVGFAFPSARFSKDSEGSRLVRGDNIGHGSLRWGESSTWWWQGDSPGEQYELAAGDVLLGMDRPWIASGIKHAVVTATDLPALLVQRVARLRPRSGVERGFLRYVVSSTDFAEYIQSVQTGTSIPHISASQVVDYRTSAASLRHQQAIAEVLGALDDKIAANRRVAGLADDARRAFYDSMLDGIESPLSSLAEFVNGRAYTKDASGTGRVVIRIAELNSGIGGSTVYNDLEVPDDNVARPGDLLFAWSGSLTAHRWYRPEGIVNQHIFKVIPKAGWPLWLVSCALDRKLEAFKAIAADKATTMGHIQRRHLDELVAVLSGERIQAMDATMQSLWDRALAAEVESRHLANLRDALLPHLMSGRITVRQAEALAGEAL